MRVPGKGNVQICNTAPAFYSSRLPIQSNHPDPLERSVLNGMMDERFTIFTFANPLPMHTRKADWPVCAKCAAGFYLNGLQTCDGPISALAPPPPTASTPGYKPSDVASALAEVARLRGGGFLTDEEFQMAKRRILEGR